MFASKYLYKNHERKFVHCNWQMLMTPCPLKDYLRNGKLHFSTYGHRVFSLYQAQITSLLLTLFAILYLLSECDPHLMFRFMLRATLITWFCTFTYKNKHTSTSRSLKDAPSGNVNM